MSPVMRGSPIALALVLFMSGPSAWAGSFTPAQRAEIVGIVRDALRSDPSILRDAIASLQAREREQQDTASKAALARDHKRLFGDPADPVAGNPAGDVTVVEFYDTRCPYCRQVEPAIAALLKADPNVRLVYKDLPILGPSSLLEARALLAAQRQGGYPRLQQEFMHANGEAGPATIRAAAEKAGLDAARLLRDMDDPAIAARLQANIALARDLDIEGTPVIVVGDRMILGAVDLPDLRSAVARARKG